VKCKHLKCHENGIWIVRGNEALAPESGSGEVSLMELLCDEQPAHPGIRIAR